MAQEHKSIQGGEVWLPFARSRIKALRATGLEYAAQKYEVGGATIKVRVTPGADYISIEGGASILSGAVKGAELFTYPVEDGSGRVMRSFRATPNCAEKVLHDETKAEGFFESSRLAVEPYSPLFFPNISGVTEAAQVGFVTAGLYTGKMREVVQVLLGTRTKIKYDYRFERTHGVFTDSDGVCWLVEISRENGVIAQKMGIAERTSATDSQPVRAFCADRFKGIPAGRTFPEDIPEAIAAKSVIRLAEASDLDEFYEKLPYTSAMGWSFKGDGTEAHNTCYDSKETSSPPPETPDATTLTTAYHYKIDINIEQDEEGVTSGSAVLTLVSSGQILRLHPYGSSATIIPHKIAFWEPLTTAFNEMPDGELYEQLQVERCVDLGSITLIAGFDENGDLFTVKRHIDLSTIHSDGANTSIFTGEPIQTVNFADFVTERYDLEIRKKAIEGAIGPIFTTPYQIIGWAQVLGEDGFPRYDGSFYSGPSGDTPHASWRRVGNPGVYNQYLFFPAGYRDGFSIITDVPEGQQDYTTYAEGIPLYEPTASGTGWGITQNPAGNTPGSIPQEWVAYVAVDGTLQYNNITVASFESNSVPVDALSLDYGNRSAIRDKLEFLTGKLNFRISAIFDTPQYALSKDLSNTYTTSGALLVDEPSDTSAFYNFVGHTE